MRPTSVNTFVAGGQLNHCSPATTATHSVVHVNNRTSFQTIVVTVGAFTLVTAAIELVTVLVTFLRSCTWDQPSLTNLYNNSFSEDAAATSIYTTLVIFDVLVIFSSGLLIASNFHIKGFQYAIVWILIVPVYIWFGTFASVVIFQRTDDGILETERTYHFSDNSKHTVPIVLEIWKTIGNLVGYLYVLFNLSAIGPGPDFSDNELLNNSSMSLIGSVFDDDDELNEPILIQTPSIKLTPSPQTSSYNGSASTTPSTITPSSKATSTSPEDLSTNEIWTTGLEPGNVAMGIVQPRTMMEYQLLLKQIFPSEGSTWPDVNAPSSTALQ